MAHAFLSPSGAPAWMRCNAKPWREKGLPDSSSPDADLGTAAHYLLEQCLDKQVDADHFTGNAIALTDKGAVFQLGGAYPVGPDMTREVQKALDYIRKVADGATIWPEQSLSVAYITREYWHKTTGAVCFKRPGGEFVDLETGEIYTEEDVEPATGTTDVFIIKGRIAHVLDLKYGVGVQVFAEENEQAEMYADAALEEFDVLGEVEEVHLHIVQPRLDHFDEVILARAELNHRIELLDVTAFNIINTPVQELAAVPGEKQCRFCKVKATCPENREFLLGAVADEFVDLDKGFVQVSMEQAEKLLAQSFGVTPKAITFEHSDEGAHFTVKKPNIRPTLEEAVEKLANADDERLATLMDAADMIEGFAKAVRAEVERRLLAGTFSDARFKLVEGRQGNRAWMDEAEAEKTLKAMRLKVDEMYDFKLISPTSAEKLLQAANPRKWAKLQPMIGRADGKPSVAPASDKRPALTLAITEQFEVLPEAAQEPEVAQEPEGVEDLV